MARRDRRASPLVDSLAVGFRRGSRRFDAPGDRSILRYVSSLIKQSFGSIGGSVMGLASICLIEVIGHLCLVTRCGAGLLDGIIICRRVGCPASSQKASRQPTADLFSAVLGPNWEPGWMVRGAQLVGHRSLQVSEGFGRCASFNTLRARRLRVLAHCQDRNAAFSPAACGDPNCRAHTESARLGAKE
jgi:hypothetical protein